MSTKIKGWTIIKDEALDNILTCSCGHQHQIVNMSARIITDQLQKDVLDPSTEARIRKLLGKATEISQEQYLIMQKIINNALKDVQNASTFGDVAKYGNINIFTDTIGVQTLLEANFAKMFNFGLQFSNKTPEPVLKKLQTDVKKGAFDWIKTMGDDLKTKCGEILSKGLKNESLPDDLSKQLQHELQITKPHADMIARTETMRAAHEGSYAQAVKDGMKYYVIDPRAEACKICHSAYLGVVFSIEDMSQFPPLHPHCYQKDTEVYTNNGWKLFKNVNDNDLILSMNPETHETEFIPFVRKIEYHYQGEMYHIHNKWFDMKITSDHDVYTEKRVDHGKQGRYLEPRFVKPSELHSEHRIPRTCDYTKQSPNKIIVNGVEFKPEDYAFFMAWWLAEGHIVTTRHSVIGISQFGDELNKIHERIQKMFPEINVYITGNRTVEFRHKKLYDYLSQFGKSNQKYIPKEIFQLSKEHLNIFLDCYVKGDGTERKCDNYLVNNSSEREVFTSSKQLADDLSYLILLAGFYPGFHIEKTKGKTQKFENGTYTINNDLIRISINKTKHTNISGCTIDIFHYDDMVYCLELPKWHTLWIKSNNKTSWGGNCACVPIYYRTRDEAQADAKSLHKDVTKRRKELEKEGLYLPENGTGPLAKGAKGYKNPNQS